MKKGKRFLISNTQSEKTGGKEMIRKSTKIESHEGG